MKYATPLPEALIDELFPFWSAIFGEAAWDVDRAVFLGAEEATSRSTLYLQRAGTELAGTCFMMQQQPCAPRLRQRMSLNKQCLSRWILFMPASAQNFMRTGWRSGVQPVVYKGEGVP